MRIILFFIIVNKLDSNIMLFRPLTNQAIWNITLLFYRLSDVFASLAFCFHGRTEFMHPHPALGASIDWVHSLLIVAEA